MKWICEIGIFAWFLLALIPQEIQAQEELISVDLGFRLSNRFAWKHNVLHPYGSIVELPRPPGSEPWMGGQVAYEDPLNLRFSQGEVGYSMLIGVDSRIRLLDSIGITLRLDSGELRLPAFFWYDPSPDCSFDERCTVTSNYQSLAEQAKSTGFVRELVFEFGLGLEDWTTLKVGKMLLSEGQGFILDNYVIGCQAKFDLDLGFGLPFKISSDLLWPDGTFTQAGKNSPMAMLKISYLISFFEEIGLFFSWYRDGDDNLAQIVLPILTEAALNAENGRLFYLALMNQSTQLRSSGDLFWIGLHANRVFESVSLSVTTILEFGSFELIISPQDRADIISNPTTFGGMVDLHFAADISDWCSLGMFFLFLSGETYSKESIREDINASYSSFLSIYPYITHTNLFFSGGMNENFSNRTFSTSGVNGRGVITPGITAGFEITEDILIRWVGALLFSHGKHLTSENHFYGFETDLNATWNIAHNIRLFVEADYLYTGNFFDFAKPLEKRWDVNHPPSMTVEPAAFKIMLGLDLVY